MARILFENAGKTYPGNVRAVDDFSLEVCDGECLAVVGPSGCGKSTVLRMIAGLEPLTSGTLRIGERIVNDVPASERDIAMVFQNYALYPHMTVAQNLAFALEIRKVPAAERAARVAEVAEALGIAGLLKRRPAQLSGGQRQRVAMGRAIVRRPQIYLMDEPLSNLDARLRVEMRTELKRLHQRLAVTTVYVTHDQVEAMTLGDRIAVMRDGRLQQLGTPEMLFNEPANVFVAEFIGSPSMNFARGRLAADGEPRLVVGERSFSLGPATFANRPALRAHFGREVIVGIRPDDFELREDADGAFVFDAVPEVVEILGNVQDVVFALDSNGQASSDRLWTASLPARSPVRRGERLRLAIDPARVHFFDAQAQAIR